MHCPVTDLAKQLISRESVSPDGNGCQALMTERLIAAGFTVEPMPFGDTQNFWAYRGVVKVKGKGEMMTYFLNGGPPLS